MIAKSYLFHRCDLILERSRSNTTMHFKLTVKIGSIIIATLKSYLDLGFVVC